MQRNRGFIGGARTDCSQFFCVRTAWSVCRGDIGSGGGLYQKLRWKRRVYLSRRGYRCRHFVIRTDATVAAARWTTNITAGNDVAIVGRRLHFLLGKRVGKHFWIGFVVGCA